MKREKNIKRKRYSQIHAKKINKYSALLTSLLIFSTLFNLISVNISLKLSPAAFIVLFIVFLILTIGIIFPLFIFIGWIVRKIANIFRIQIIGISSFWLSVIILLVVKHFDIFSLSFLFQLVLLICFLIVVFLLIWKLFNNTIINFYKNLKSIYIRYLLKEYPVFRDPRGILIGLLTGFIFILISGSGVFNYFESLFLSSCFKTRNSLSSYSDFNIDKNKVILVAMDEMSKEKIYNQTSPFAIQIQALEKLSKINPDKVIIQIDPIPLKKDDTKTMGITITGSKSGFSTEYSNALILEKEFISKPLVSAQIEDLKEKSNLIENYPDVKVIIWELLLHKELEEFISKLEINIENINYLDFWGSGFIQIIKSCPFDFLNVSSLKFPLVIDYYSREAGPIPVITYEQLFNSDRVRWGDNLFNIQELIKDKIVILSPYIDLLVSTPQGNFSGAELLATSINTILNPDTHFTFINDLVKYLLILLLSIFLGLTSFKKNTLFIFLQDIGFMFFTFIIGYFFFFNYILFPIAEFIAVIIFSSITSVHFSYLRQSMGRVRTASMLKKYLSPNVIETLDPENLQLGGTKQEIAVLFTDVRGFTPLTMSREGKEVVETINSYLTVMTEKVFKFNGTLDKYTGDGLLAFWGAPVKDKDYKRNAFLCAAKIQKVCFELSCKRRKENKLVLEIGVGIASGQSVVGNIGSSERMDYTALGQPVVISARIQALASSGEIVFTEEFLQIAKELGTVNKLEGIKLKGIKEPPKLFKLSHIMDIK